MEFCVCKMRKAIRTEFRQSASSLLDCFCIQFLPLAAKAYLQKIALKFKPRMWRATVNKTGVLFTHTNKLEAHVTRFNE